MANYDFAATLISLGFEQQVNVDQCLFVHKTRDIDFGLYVGDCEAAANDEQENDCQTIRGSV
jgi:hypothetical protein